MVWTRQSVGERGLSKGDSDDSDTDSEEEGVFLIHCCKMSGRKNREILAGHFLANICIH